MIVFVHITVTPDKELNHSSMLKVNYRELIHRVEWLKVLLRKEHLTGIWVGNEYHFMY